MQYLLSTGKVNPLVKNKKGETPIYKQDYKSNLPDLLHLAAAHGWVDFVIDLTMKYKYDTKCKDSDGHTPLHYAACNNHLEVVRYLINKQHCDPMTRDNYGDTILHLACNYSHVHIVQYLLSTGQVDPLAKNRDGKTPMYKQDSKSRQPLLHLAAAHGWMDIVVDLLTKYKYNTNCKDSHGFTPLRYAASNNHLEVVRYFVIEQHCNPMTKDKNGDTILHIACNYSHVHIVQYLLSTGKVNPMAKNKYGKTPMFKVQVDNTNRLPLLHLATHYGWLDIVIDLITKYKCDTNCKDSRGHTPLHYAAINNHLEVVRYLINEQHCNPMTYIYGNSDTILHYSCRCGHLNITQYLISEAHCSPSCENKDGDTPLHVACEYRHTHIVQYLLSTGIVDPLAKNKHGSTPFDYASIQDNSYDLLKLFHSFSQCEKNFPVHTYTKLILTGYSGAGKTTISQLILLLASKISWLSSGRVTDVECLTAGIIPLHVESKVNKVGNMVIYDFAGQQEYYSSHAAVLESIMRNSAAIFVCIVDLSQCMDKISESIHYWISFIENACSSAQGSSHVIIVGSHADLVKPSRELKEKSSLVESIAESRVKQLTYEGFVNMDCRLSKTKEARHFRSLLSTSQQAILSSQPSMSLYCHVLYAFLCTKLRKTSCTLQELTTDLASEEDFFSDSTVLTESLTSLRDKGLILLVHNHEDLQSSWVVGWIVWR